MNIKLQERPYEVVELELCKRLQRTSKIVLAVFSAVCFGLGVLTGWLIF